MKKNKQKKKDKKILAIVKKEFMDKPLISDNLIKAIAKSASLNKSMIKKDKKEVKKWQKEYMNELFSDFQRLIRNHNERMGFNVNKLINEINTLKTQKSKLKDEIKTLQKEKEALLIESK